MARPKEFDKGKAIHAAILVFSRKGFSATSTDDLMLAMNIGRQSMYDTFGDKRSLFLEALEIYVQESQQAICAELQRPGSPLAAVRRALVSFAQRKDLCSADGCMGINAICEFGGQDRGVIQTMHGLAGTQRRILLEVLSRAKAEGELSHDAEVESLADFFESTLAGIRISAKGGRSRSALKRVAEVACKAFGL